MPKITPFLWFDHQAEEAANFYVSLFPNSKILGTTHYGKAGAEASGRAEGSVMTVMFELDGQQFTALNGGPVFHFTPAISLFIHCQTQAEVDELWEKLAEGGRQGQCGWLEDKYGVSWQVVPVPFIEMLMEGDDETESAMKALLKMEKLDLETLQKAHQTGA
ncbi:MAG: VOC family protein [Chthoniobacteraceae bacterium]